MKGAQEIKAFKVNTIPSLLFAMLLVVALPARAQQIDVTFLNPTTEHEVFWKRLTNCMAKAAKDLNLNLNVVYGQHDRFNSIKLAEQILSAEKKPDYLVFQMQAQVGQQILKLAEKHQVKTIVINTDVPQEDRYKSGYPRGKYKHWIGHIFPNDEIAGHLLALRLYKEASENPKVRGNTGIIAVTGTRDNDATFDRISGLERFIMSRPNLVLDQTLFAAWDYEKAKEGTAVLLKRYRGNKIIWSASDKMALGAAAAVKELGPQKSYNYFIGGMDWTQDALRAIKNREIIASVGGHFLEGAWAMVLLHDYAHGSDFAITNGTTIQTDMNIIDHTNVDQHLEMFEEKFWQNIDFRQYSMHLNKNLSAYDFKLSM